MEFLRNQVNQRVLNDLKSRSSIGIIFYIILSFIVVVSDDYYKTNLKFSFLFFTSIALICSLRYLHIFFFSRLEGSHPKLNATLFSTNVGLTALIWGIGFAFFLAETGDFNNKLIITVCTTGLCAGGVVAFIPDRKLALAFNLLMVGPAIVFLAISGVFQALLFMLILYSGYLFLIVKRGNNEYWDALENEHILKEQTKILEEVSRTDVLTGLYNRRHFDEVFESEWKRASRDNKPCTMIIGDIDHFKLINDIYGHLAGDEYLKEVAEILKSVFRREIDVVARYGGEEFVVLLIDTHPDQACELAEKARAEVENTVLYYDKIKITATISFGIASLIPDFEALKTTLVSKADAALYQAKHEGRNQVKLF